MQGDVSVLSGKHFSSKKEKDILTLTEHRNRVYSVNTFVCAGFRSFAFTSV